MTILDYDKREPACPTCGAARLIFITDAPRIRPVGRSVQYRCKPCAIAEAEPAGDPIVVIRHCERRYLPPAWESEKRPDPAHLKAARERMKNTRGKAMSDAVQRV